MSIADQIKAVNRLLETGEPENISVDSFSGFTGYKPQYIIDAMNEVFGWGNWGFEEISNEPAEGEKVALIVSQVRVFLKECTFQPTGWGQARITKGDIGDARKGAQTDAMKKALSYFSIGSRAYRGHLGVPSSQQNAPQSRQNGQKTPQQQSLPTEQKTPIQRAIDAAKQRALVAKLIANEAEFSGLLDKIGVPKPATGQDINKINTAISEMVAAAK